MQQYTAIESTNSIRLSRQMLLNNDLTCLTNSSGDVFPTATILEGRTCWRTDLGRLYLRTNDAWNLVWDSNKTLLYREDANSTYAYKSHDHDSRYAIKTRAETFESSLTVNGNLSMSGNLIHTSDKRVKKGIKTVVRSLERLCKSRGVRYQMKDSDVVGFGVVAQELEKQFPELVLEQGDYKAVNYVGLSAYFIEAFKEVNKRLVALESK